MGTLRTFSIGPLSGLRKFILIYEEIKTLQKVGPIKFGALTGLAHGAGSTEPIEGNFLQKTGHRIVGGSDDAVIGAGFAKALTKAAPPAITFLSKLKSKLSFKSGSMYR